LFNVADPIDSGPIMWGSRRAAQMLSDLAAGTDSVDFIVIGDSNTMSASANAWGYHNGFSQALNDKGWNVYGTPVYPAMIVQPTGVTDSPMFGWNTSAYLYAPTGNLASGNAATSTTYYTNWTPSTTWVLYGSATASPPAKFDWAYIASGTYFQNYNAVEIHAAHPLNSTSLTLYHRVRWGGFNTGSGAFRGRTRLYNAPNTTLADGASQSTNNGTTYSFNAYEYSFTPTGAWLHSSWTSGGGSGATGPVAIHSHSIYCRRKGWSVTSHGYFAGYTSAQINTAISGIGATQLRTHLQEIRERQILAGGSGRVILLTHSGINGNETSTDWVNCHKAIWNTYKAAWSALGYPASDLAIISWVGVQRNSDDSSLSGSSGNLIAVRDAAKQMALDNPDMTVVNVKSFMNYAIAITGNGNGTTFYQGGATAATQHLSGGYTSGGPPSGTKATSDGYTLVAHDILNSVLWNA